MLNLYRLTNKPKFLKRGEDESSALRKTAKWAFAGKNKHRKTIIKCIKIINLKLFPKSLTSSSLFDSVLGASSDSEFSDIGLAFVTGFEILGDFLLGLAL